MQSIGHGHPIQNLSVRFGVSLKKRVLFTTRESYQYTCQPYQLTTLLVISYLLSAKDYMTSSTMDMILSTMDEDDLLIV